MGMEPRMPINPKKLGMFNGDPAHCCTLTCWLLSSAVATSAALLHPDCSHQTATASCAAGSAGSASQMAAHTAGRCVRWGQGV